MHTSEDENLAIRYSAVVTCPICLRSVKLTGGGIDPRFIDTVEIFGRSLLEDMGCSHEMTPQIVLIPVRDR